MNCFSCKSDLKENTTSYVVTLKKCVIIVKNVPCEECSQCGEAYFNDEVMEQLEKIVNTLRTAITEIAIVNYSNEVA